MEKHPTKESLTVEFKSDKKCISMDVLYEELVGMANSEGGSVYLGVEDDGTPTGVNEQHRNIQKILAQIQDNTTPALLAKANMVSWNGVDVLEISVLSSRQLVMTSKGRYLHRRISQNGQPENLPMSPQEIMQRLSYIQTIDPSAQIIEDVSPQEALSTVERERLRTMIKTYHGDETLLNLTDEDLDKALGFVKLSRGKYFPTIAGLLIIGKEDFIVQYIPNHEVIFQVLEDTTVLVNTPAMRSPLLQVFERISVLFQSRVTEQELQIGLFRVPIPNFEPQAFREGFVNALVHRDYFKTGAVIVQLQNDSLSIISPGGFVEGIEVDNILNAAPTPRNTLLAEAVKRIGLAERTGRGIPKIYSSTLRSGHPFPDYSYSNKVHVILRLYSSQTDEAFVKMLVTEEQKTQRTIPVDALILLSALKEEKRANIHTLATRMQKEEYRAKMVVEALIETGLVEGVGNGPSRRYMLSAALYEISGNKAGYTRQKGWTSIQEKEMIIAHFENFQTITRKEVMELCKCNKDHATWLLQQLRKENKIKLSGTGRNSQYVLVRV